MTAAKATDKARRAGGFFPIRKPSMMPQAIPATPPPMKPIITGNSPFGAGASRAESKVSTGGIKTSREKTAAFSLAGGRVGGVAVT